MPAQQPVATAAPVKRQAGISEAVKPVPRVVKKEDADEDKETRQLSSDAPESSREGTEKQSPAPALVQQAPAPAPAPVQQAPAPAPAPVQQAPAPAPGITIDLGGRGAVDPQAPIAPKKLHFG